MLVNAVVRNTVLYVEEGLLWKIQMRRGMRWVLGHAYVSWLVHSIINKCVSWTQAEISINIGTGAPGIFLWGRGLPWGWTYFMSDFENCVMKIMSKSPSRYLVRLQRKLKLTEKQNNVHVCKFYLNFLIFQCSCHQPISLADWSWSVSHVKPLVTSYVQNLWFFFNFRFGGAAARAGGRARPPPPSPQPPRRENLKTSQIGLISAVRISTQYMHEMRSAFY
jgi:hypothetical protein